MKIYEKTTGFMSLKRFRNGMEFKQAVLVWFSKYLNFSVFSYLFMISDLNLSMIWNLFFVTWSNGVPVIDIYV